MRYKSPKKTGDYAATHEVALLRLPVVKCVCCCKGECHLLWSDICGYDWDKTQERIQVPIASERQRQTYYGAFDYHSKQFDLPAYDTGNTDNTIAFLKYQRSLDQ